MLEPGCKLGEGVHIGPFCVVGAGVRLGDAVRLDSHVRVAGHTEIGAGSVLDAFCTVGAAPQDLKYDGEQSVVRIGERCRVAEYAHISGGTAAGGGITSVGDGCLIMSHCHVAHDCVLGDDVVLASSSALAGHVHVGDGARISGCAAVHQKVSIGRGAFVGGGSVLVHDLIPHGLAVGNRAHLHGLNLVGLRRHAVPPTELRAMLAAFRYLFDSAAPGFFRPLALEMRPTLHERAAECAADAQCARHPRLREMVEFVLGERDVVQPRQSVDEQKQRRAGVADGAGEDGGGARQQQMSSVRRALCQPPPRTGG